MIKAERRFGCVMIDNQSWVCFQEMSRSRKGVRDLGDYLTEIAIFSLQIEENVHILIDDSDILQLEERQISQLHQLLGRVKTLLEWKRPRPQS
jgi:hypothetical protein